MPKNVVFISLSIYFLLFLPLFSNADNKKGDSKKNVTTYKKNLVAPPPNKWVSSSQTPEKKKEEEEAKKAPNKVRVTYVYDTLNNGVKSKVVGYRDEENTFVVDSAMTYRVKQDIPVKQKSVAEPPAVPKEDKFSSTEGIHISHSSIPDQNTCNFLIDYINGYNKNYGNRLRRLKVTKAKTLAYIDKTMLRQGLPRQMKYLAVIESSLNENAVSPVGAVGVWQFMSPTARDMNLVVDQNQDQRRDLYKSTYAASKYMKHLYRIFGDWLLVIASYNSGPGPVLSAIRKTGSKNFWLIRNRLPRETRGHVLAFLATAAIMEKLDKFSGLYDRNPGAINMKIEDNTEDEIEKKPDFDRHFNKGELNDMAVLSIDLPMHSDIICKRLEIKPEDFNRWNPEFNKTLGQKNAKYRMYIPRSKMEGYVEMKFKMLDESSALRAQTAKASVTAATTTNVQQTTRLDKTKNHIVQYGETIDGIAEIYQTTSEKIMDINHMKDATLYPGDIIRVQ